MEPVSVFLNIFLRETILAAVKMQNLLTFSASKIQMTESSAEKLMHIGGFIVLERGTVKVKVNTSILLRRL